MDDFIRTHEWDNDEVEEMLEDVLHKELQKYPGANVPLESVKNQAKGMFNYYKPFMTNFFKRFMTMDGPFHRSLAINTLMSAMNREIGILCLTEKRDNLLMWAHYASNHTGFVIAFDENHSFFDQRKRENEIRGHLKKVRYSMKRPEVTLFDPSLSNQENMDRWIKDIFWVKSQHWKYEQEWRMSNTLRDCQRIVQSDSYDIHLFSIPNDCIVGIIFGCKISNADKRTLLETVNKDKEYSHVILFQAIMDGKEYKLNFEEI